MREIKMDELDEFAENEETDDELNIDEFDLDA